MPTITLACPTYRRYDLLGQMVASAERGTVVPDRYYIVDNGGSFVAGAHGLPTVKTEVASPGRNMGVSASWNVTLSRHDDIVIMVCDDVVLGTHTVEALVQGYEAHPEIGFFFPESASMFTVYLQRKSLFEKLGPYDEQFWPAYFEDNDMYRRMGLAGERSLAVTGEGVGYYHHLSATMKTYNADEMRDHHARFEACQRYYVQKWGGMPHHERFATPFGR